MHEWRRISDSSLFVPSMWPAHSPAMDESIFSERTIRSPLIFRQKPPALANAYKQDSLAFFKRISSEWASSHYARITIRRYSCIVRSRLYSIWARNYTFYLGTFDFWDLCRPRYSISAGWLFDELTSVPTLLTYRMKITNRFDSQNR